MNTAPRLAGLDALRGIAALLVMGLHANAVFHGLAPFSKGYLGVDFFLMLSGLPPLTRIPVSLRFRTIAWTISFPSLNL